LASIKDVAKKAGVSVAAVSKYLKTPENMRETTRTRIAQAITELNYHPNPLAQSLRTGRTHIIAITLPEVDNPYFTKMFKLLQERCEEWGYLAVLLKNSNADQAKRNAGLIKSGLADGVICYDEGQVDIFMAEAASHVPIVKLSTLPSSDYPATVGIDLRPGIRKLCQHLEQTGVRRLGYFGPDKDISSMQKIQAIRDCCCESSLYLDPEVFVTNCDSYNTGYDRAKELLASGARLPEAIIVESDMIAVGVLKGLIEGGLQVPRDIRVSGYDNTDISQMSNPSLTSVHIPLEEICTCAITMLNQLLNDQPVFAVHFQTDLIVRTSTLSGEQ